MATLHVRNVPDPLYEALRACADGEGRSIGAQTVFLLEQALLLGRRPRSWLEVRRRPGPRRPLFHRFTGKGRAAVRLAQDEARDLGHDFIGTEHLLLGLLRMEDSVAARALDQLRLDEAKLRSRVNEIVGPGPGTAHGQLSFTPRAKKVLELALRESLALRHDYIGTEHILLAIMREAEGVAARALGEQGIEEQHVRGAVIALLAQGPAAAAPPREEPEYLAVDLDGEAAQWTERLNGLAADGWELMSLQQLGERTRAVLRRAE